MSDLPILNNAGKVSGELVKFCYLAEELKITEFELVDEADLTEQEPLEEEELFELEPKKVMSKGKKIIKEILRILLGSKANEEKH